MAEDGPRIATAFIELKARKAGDFDSDARRAGKEAGKEYEKSFEREAGKESSGAKAKRTAQGKKAGAEIGDAAGKEAGARTSKGISDGLVKARAERKKDGDEVGRAIGVTAGTTAAKEISARLRRNRAGFLRDGQDVGRAIGDGASASLRTRLLFGIGATGAIFRARFKQVGVRAGLDTAAGISAALRTSLSRFRSDGAAVGAAVGAASGRRAAAATRASIRAEAVAEAKETAKAARAAEKAEKEFKERIGRIQKFASGALKGVLATGAIGGLASSIGGLGTVVAGTVGALASLSGAAGLLPGIFASAGVAISALKIGVHDISGALSDSSDPTKYAAALKKLAPAAQSFVKAIVKMKPELKDLRNQVQQGLFKGLDKQVTNLGARYLPILSQGLTGVTKGFNKGAVAVAKFLDSSKSSQQVAGILKNTATASTHLGEAFKPVVKGLLDLTSVGAGFLPKLSSGIGSAATRLADFIDSAHKSGDLRQFIQGGIDGFKELGSVIGGAGRIIGGIFKAGGGADFGGLGALAGILNSVADQIARPEFQKGLSSFFKSIGSAGDSVGGALPAVADALIALQPALSKIVSGSGTALASILTSAASAAQSLAPLLESLAGGLEKVAPHAGAVVGAFLALKGVLGALRFAVFIESLATSATVLKGIAIATRLWAGAQVLLNIALTANPIGLVIVGVAALAAAFILAYKKSETFRNGVNAVFRFVANMILTHIGAIIAVFGALFGVLSHLPGKAGDAFRAAANAAQRAKNKVDELKESINRLHGKEVRLLVKTEYRATFDSELSRDAAMSRRGGAMTGGLISSTGAVRRASGGFVNPRLGGPRQDNVPLLVSGGEFVVNAFATAQPGVLSLLRKINASNQMPKKLANGGQVAGRVSAGFGDLSSSQPARIERMSTIPVAAAPASSGLTRDDLDYILAGFERIQRQQRIYLDSGAIAGSVLKEAGRL